MRILSIVAMLLSFGVTADAQRVSNRFPEITFGIIRSVVRQTRWTVYIIKNLVYILPVLTPTARARSSLQAAVICECRASRAIGCSGDVRWQTNGPDALCSVCAVTKYIWFMT